MNIRKIIPLAALALVGVATAGFGDQREVEVQTLPPRPGFDIVYDTVVERRLETRYVTQTVDAPAARTDAEARRTEPAARGAARAVGRRGTGCAARSRPTTRASRRQGS